MARGIVEHCGCAMLAEITAKTGQKVKVVCTSIPFHTRNAGAAFQDKLYGVGMRMHNGMKNGSRRCTVCTRVKG